MVKAVGVTSLEGCSIAGKIILGLKAMCCAVVIPDKCLWLMSKKTCYIEDPFAEGKSESAFVLEAIAFSSCTQ